LGYFALHVVHVYANYFTAADYRIFLLSSL